MGVELAVALLSLYREDIEVVLKVLKEAEETAREMSE